MTTIEQIMIDQIPIAGGWICPRCINHRGGISCIKGYFISAEGCNTSNCQSFVDKDIQHILCPHCQQWIAVMKDK